MFVKEKIHYIGFILFYPSKTLERSGRIGVYEDRGRPFFRPTDQIILVNDFLDRRSEKFASLRYFADGLANRLSARFGWVAASFL